MPESLPAKPAIANPVAIGSSGIPLRSTTDPMEIAARGMGSHLKPEGVKWKAVARDKKTNWPDVYPGLRVAEDYEPRELEIQVPGAPVRVMRVPELPVLAAEAERSAEFPPEAADSSAPTGAGEEGGESPTESGASGPEPVPPAGGPLEPPPLPPPDPDPGDPPRGHGSPDLQRNE